MIQVTGRQKLSEMNVGPELAGMAAQFTVPPDTTSEWADQDLEDSRRAVELAIKFRQDADRSSNPVKKVKIYILT